MCNLKFIDECEDCGETVNGGICLVEALETFDAFLCTDCFDARCEAKEMADDALGEKP